MTEEIRLSVEETNKLRAQLGLALLPTEIGKSYSKSNTKSSSKTFSLNFDETNRLRRSLGLRPIVDFADDDNGNDKSYTNSKDKKAENSNVWKVGHSKKELGRLKEGDVFTLEDKSVLDDEDCLVNEDLITHGKQEKIDREKKNLGLTKNNTFFSNLHDEEESEVDLQPVQLIGSAIELPKQGLPQEIDYERKNITKFTDLFEDSEPDLKPSKKKKQIKFKKSKLNQTAKKRVNEDFQEVQLTTSTMTTLTFALEDEETDELEEALSKVRQYKARKRGHMTAEEIASEAQMNFRIDLIAELKDGIVYDDTGDFLDTLAPMEKLYGVEPNDDKSSQLKCLRTNEDVLPTELAEPIRDVKPAEIATLKEVEPAEAIQLKNETVSELKLKGEAKQNQSTEQLDNIISDSKDHGDDIAAKSKFTDAEQAEEVEQRSEFASVLSTLKFLRQNAFTTSEADKKTYKMKRIHEKEQSLIQIKISIQERIVREELEKDPTYTKLTEEKKAVIFDRVLSERLIDKGIIAHFPSKGRYNRYNRTDELADYNPQIQIRYKDQTGQVLDRKQAWKALSHKYHGLAPKNVKRAKTKN